MYPTWEICQKEFPVSSDWDNDIEEEEGKDQDKGENQKDSERKTPSTNPRFFMATTLTPQPPKPSIKQFSKRSSVTPDKEEHKCDTLTTVLGHENQDTLEDID